jgi:GrpB-like predicted nucleotidyltransferase (UPF0157 family)
MTTRDVDEPTSIVEPDPDWHRLFEAEVERLRPVLIGLATRIEHVGSTAVPGLAGKPIIDLLVGVRTLAEGRTAAGLVAARGYEDFGEIIIPGRLYLRRRGPPDFNVAIAEDGGPFFNAQLAVRDYLRTHLEEARAYADEKRRVYAEGARLFSTYSQQKHAFVTALVARALCWAGGRGPRERS